MAVRRHIEQTGERTERLNRPAGRRQAQRECLIVMLRSLFGKGKKRSPAPNLPAQDTVRDARVGDVVTVRGLALEYDDLYFVVERRHRYGGRGIIWYELVVADADHRVWLEWQDDDGELFITATDDRRPTTLDALGLSEADLITLDEQHSIGNHVTFEGRRYFYRNSFEAFYFQDNRAVGDGFYLWDFMAEDESRALAITKFEGMPYEAHFSEVILPEDVALYPGERPEHRRQ